MAKELLSLNLDHIVLILNFQDQSFLISFSNKKKYDLQKFVEKKILDEIFGNVSIKNMTV